MRFSVKSCIFLISLFSICYFSAVFESENGWRVQYRSVENCGDQKIREIKTTMHNGEYCTAYNFLEAKESFREEDGLEPVTLAIHSTSEIMKTLEGRPLNWDGPVSLGLFVDHHSQKALEYLEMVHRCDMDFGRKTSIHFAFRLSAFQNFCPVVKITLSNIPCEEFRRNRNKLRSLITAPFQLYPSNLMRNMARKGAKSDLHFLADADMTLSAEFAVKVKEIANRMLDGKSRRVLVVRRFETNGTIYPKNHVELEKMVQQKKVFQFHHKFFFEGHKIANISSWFRMSNKTNQVVAWPIPYTNSLWEVQPILHRNDLYNADYFPSRVKVMQSLIYGLCRANYTFHLLSHVFDVHDGIKLDDSHYSKAVISHQRMYERKRAHDRYEKELNASYPETFKRCGKFVM